MYPRTAAPSTHAVVASELSPMDKDIGSGNVGFTWRDDGDGSAAAAVKVADIEVSSAAPREKRPLDLNDGISPYDFIFDEDEDDSV